MAGIIVSTGFARGNSALIRADNEDNVVCITPSKNKQALPALKDDLMLSILTKDRDYDDWIIDIDRKYHRALQAETRAYLHHIELVHGASIRFLPREDGQDAIEVFASRYHAQVIHDLLTVSGVLGSRFPSDAPTESPPGRVDMRIQYPH